MDKSTSIKSINYQIELKTNDCVIENLMNNDFESRVCTIELIDWLKATERTSADC